MRMALSTSALCSPGASCIRNLDRVFEEAQLRGILQLNARKLKEFPGICCKYDLSDVFKADVSKNRLSELPEELCNCLLLEDLDCHNNIIRSVPDAVARLSSLTYLDLSRNQLTVIPLSLCHLQQLQVLSLRNNRLVSVPEEIATLTALRDLDVSCNEITILPPQLGSVSSLQRVNLKRNLLLEIPVELCRLRLNFLDISCNRISSIPTQLRLMSNSLQDLILDQNPLTFPPALLCKRGRIHVFKFLEIQAIKEDKRGILLDTEFHKLRSPSIMSDTRLHNGFGCRKSYTFDSGYSTSDGDCRSQESQELRKAESPRWETTLRSTNSSSLFGAIPVTGIEDVGEEVQTFREYKEALKKKREAVYRKNPEDTNGSLLSPSSKNKATKTESPTSSTEDNVLVTEWSSEGPSDIPKTANIQSLRKSVEKKVEEPSGKNLSWPKNSPKSSFTMRRELDKAREEQELIGQLREVLESRLKLRLPESDAELSAALSDGVFLCHLANHVCPQAVACVHVPSPAVPKLTVAKCRRNADNFLEACRRLGVPNAEPSHQSTSSRVVSSFLLLCLLFGTALLLHILPEPAE